MAYQDKCCTDCVLAFTSSCIKIEGSFIDDEEPFILEWGIEDILYIKSHWYQLAGMTMLKIRVLMEDDTLQAENVECPSDYLKKVEADLTAICNEILLAIEEYLLPLSNCPQASVAYWKLKADYSSYLVEFDSGRDRYQAIYESQKAYEAATALAESYLPPTDPLRLSLYLNFSSFLHRFVISFFNSQV